MNDVERALIKKAAIAKAAVTLRHAVAQQAERTPREAAEIAWYPGHRLGTVEAIEAKIIARRAAADKILAERDAAAAKSRPLAA